MTARSKDASQIKFSRCLGDEKLQNKYFKKNKFPEVLGSRKMQNQKNFEKTKKTNKKTKKKNIFPEVLEMEEVRQETQNIVFFLVFLVFF